MHIRPSKSVTTYAFVHTQHRRWTDGRTEGRTDGRTENWHNIALCMHSILTREKSLALFFYRVCCLTPNSAKFRIEYSKLGLYPALPISRLGLRSRQPFLLYIVALAAGSFHICHMSYKSKNQFTMCSCTLFSIQIQTV